MMLYAFPIFFHSLKSYQSSSSLPPSPQWSPEGYQQFGYLYTRGSTGTSGTIPGAVPVPVALYPVPVALYQGQYRYQLWRMLGQQTQTVSGTVAWEDPEPEQRFGSHRGKRPTYRGLSGPLTEGVD